MALQVKLATRADPKDADGIPAWRTTLRGKVRFVRGGVIERHSLWIAEGTALVYKCA